ncbi:MAG: hypothetical protein KAJ04_04630 [Candidatus Eisenbacteria sp.]|nr:hypothetical protein [Candidatus Eisenbacteria bacterium]
MGTPGAAPIPRGFAGLTPAFKHDRTAASTRCASRGLSGTEHALRTPTPGGSADVTSVREDGQGAVRTMFRPVAAAAV